jgi:hypothetical protein
MDELLRCYEDYENFNSIREHCRAQLTSNDAENSDEGDSWKPWISAQVKSNKKAQAAGPDETGIKERVAALESIIQITTSEWEWTSCEVRRGLLKDVASLFFLFAVIPFIELLVSVLGLGLVAVFLCISSAFCGA